MIHFATLRKGHDTISRVVAAKDGNPYGERKNIRISGYWYACRTCHWELDFTENRSTAVEILEEHISEHDQLVTGEGNVRVATTNPDFPLGPENAEALLKRVNDYLPRNFVADLRIAGRKDDHFTYTVVVSGIEHAGWTLDGYVLPRLASGNIFMSALEVK